ncbi:MAG: hypothetical protein LAT64_11070 [Phycisphaerales bacterium]|nr:hypothetical protein [Planctomycetota bacterium]MCH8509292.1 hypothetical protein [Phycisphaerales bacterium]
MNRRAGVAVLLVGAILLALAAWWSLRPTGLPTSDAGWAARWHAEADEVGRTPGEGWSEWVAAGATLREARSHGPLTIERLMDIVPEDGWPEQITPPAHAAAPDARWPDAMHTIADAVRAASDRADGHAVIALAALAGRIEAGMGVDAGLQGAVERFAAGAAVDRALQDAVSRGVFGPGDPGLAMLTALNDDAAGFGIDWAIRVERERALRACAEAGAHGAARLIGRLYTDLDLSARGRPGAAARVEATADALRRGEHPEAMAFLPDIDAVIDARRAARAERVGLAVMLGLERFRARTGGYPQRLGELVPIEFGRVPVDPFGFGELFGYRLIDARAERPESGYRLWSMGPNRIDDGGTAMDPDGAGDRVFNPAREVP